MKRTVLAFACLLLPLSAHAQEVRWVYPAFVTAQVLDLHSTHQALQAGAVESNPLMVQPWVRYPLKGLLTAAVLASAERGRRTAPRKTFWIVTAITVGQLAIDTWNYAHAAHLRRTR